VVTCGRRWSNRNVRVGLLCSDMTQAHHAPTRRVRNLISCGGLPAVLIRIIGVESGQLLLSLALAAMTAHRRAAFREDSPLTIPARATTLADRVRHSSPSIPDIES